VDDETTDKGDDDGRRQAVAKRDGKGPDQMIHIKPDGNRAITFDDWTGDMMTLSTRLYRMPAHPAYGGYGNHEVGIERLARLKYGDQVITALAQLAGELEHRPTEDELFALGQAWLAHKAEMVLFRRSRASQGRRERQQAQLKSEAASEFKDRWQVAKPPASPRYGFVRGN
jgi:hypothetical protein